MRDIKHLKKIIAAKSGLYDNELERIGEKIDFLKLDFFCFEFFSPDYITLEEYKFKKERCHEFNEKDDERCYNAGLPYYGTIYYEDSTYSNEENIYKLLEDIHYGNSDRNIGSLDPKYRDNLFVISDNIFDIKRINGDKNIWIVEENFIAFVLKNQHITVKIITLEYMNHGIYHGKLNARNYYKRPVIRNDVKLTIADVIYKAIKLVHPLSKRFGYNLLLKSLE